MKIRLSILFLFLTLLIFSQESPSFENFDTYTQTNFSSPEVSSFEKVSLIPNDLSTGRLNLNVPVYTIKIGRLSYPIRLSYNSGGIKVDDQASEIGLGWSLSKTVISRQIVDANDFDNLGTQQLDPIGGGFEDDVNDPEWSAHQGVTMWTNRRAGFFLKEALDIKAGITIKQVDEMPDIYSLSSSDGFSTKFYFRDITNAAVELNEQSSVINGDKVKRFFNNPAYNASTAFPYFPMYDFGKIEVISNKGIKYTFEDYDVSISTVASIPGSLWAGLHTVPQISSWYISEIEDLLTGDIIEFEYETYNADPVTIPIDFLDPTDGPDALLRFTSYKTVPKASFTGSVFPNTSNCTLPQSSLLDAGIYNYSVNKNAHRSTYDTRYYVKNRLVNIRFNGGRVNFNWGSNRLDSYNAKTLNNVSIYSKEDGATNASKLINRFDFTFDYFDSGCSNNYKCKRLRLTAIKELDKPSYQFSYFDENDYFPPITSNKKDYLGYYNSEVTQTEYSIITPNLYFYPDKQEYSILPFDIPTETSYLISGDYDDSTPILSDVKKWSLSSIRYPSGAITELDYELNEVDIFNHTSIATGLRLNSMEIKDEGNVVRSINYQYTKSDGSSSGSFVNPPNFGRPMVWMNTTNSSSEAHLSKWDLNSIGDSFIVNQYPKIDADLTKGNYILYSDVKEEEIGNGYTTYKFTSNELYPNEYIRNDDTQEELNRFTGTDYCQANPALNNSAWGIDFYTDNSYKRGMLISKRVFDSNNNMLQEIINTYTENPTVISEIFKKRFFRRTSNNPSNNGDYGPMIDVAKRYKQNTFKLKDSKTKDYYNGRTVESVSTEYDYNAIGLVSSVKKNANSGNTYINPQINGENYIEQLEYVIESNPSETGIPSLQSINFLSDLVEKKRVFNTTTNNNSDINEPISGFKKQYKSNGYVDKLSVSHKDGIYENEMFFDSYNSRGKPTQFSDKLGQITSLFWYNDLLIAKVENETYLSVKNHIQSTNGFNIENCESNNCAQYFSENLRNVFPLARIYTYAYESSQEKPVSVTDSKNETVYYEYDDIGRLIQVKDKDGNILNANEYNFKLPN